MKTFDDIYRDLVNDIIENGVDQGPNHVRAKYADGSPAPTRAIEGVMFKITPEMGVPRLRSKFVGGKWACTEMEWIYQEMSNNVNWLHEHGGVTIWDEWADSEGSIGRAYGFQVKNQTIPVEITKDTANAYDLHYMTQHKLTSMHKNLNQMEYALHELRNNPSSRRIMVDLWNQRDIPKMALTPCVYAHHWSVFGGKLNLHVKQRSADVAIGTPYNVCQYYVLKELVADCLGIEPGTMYWTIDNAHIYDRHLEKISEQVNTPLSEEVAQSNCKLILPSVQEGKQTNDTFFYRKMSETKFDGYKHMGRYDYEVAI